MDFEGDYTAQEERKMESTVKSMNFFELCSSQVPVECFHELWKNIVIYANEWLSAAPALSPFDSNKQVSTETDDSSQLKLKRCGVRVRVRSGTTMWACPSSH